MPHQRGEEEEEDEGQEAAGARACQAFSTVTHISVLIYLCICLLLKYACVLTVLGFIMEGFDLDHIFPSACQFVPVWFKDLSTYFTVKDDVVTARCKECTHTHTHTSTFPRKQLKGVL